MQCGEAGGAADVNMCRSYVSSLRQRSPPVGNLLQGQQMLRGTVLNCSLKFEMHKGINVEMFLRIVIWKLPWAKLSFLRPAALHISNLCILLTFLCPHWDLWPQTHSSEHPHSSTPAHTYAPPNIFTERHVHMCAHTPTHTLGSYVTESCFRCPQTLWPSVGQGLEDKPDDQPSTAHWQYIEVDRVLATTSRAAGISKDRMPMEQEWLGLPFTSFTSHFKYFLS